MTPETKKRIEWTLAAAILVTGARTGYVLYERHASQAAQTEKRDLPLNPDYYVTPKKLYPYDLKSARQLTQQPVWVKEGYRYTYYGYDATRKKVDFEHEAGLLLPIEQLAIQDVVTAVPPGPGRRRQVMAVFQKEGNSYAVPIGV